MKAISSQNECGSTIGLALISIHLACLCVEPAGAAAGGVGVKEVSVWCVCVCVDRTGDVAKAAHRWEHMERRRKSRMEMKLRRRQGVEFYTFGIVLLIVSLQLHTSVFYGGGACAHAVSLAAVMEHFSHCISPDCKIITPRSARLFPPLKLKSWT